MQKTFSESWDFVTYEWWIRKGGAENDLELDFLETKMSFSENYNSD